MKESKAVPNLIYLLEQYDRILIQYDKKVKSNLVSFVKRSTARDFKIEAEQIQFETQRVVEEEEKEEEELRGDELVEDDEDIDELVGDDDDE